MRPSKLVSESGSTRLAEWVQSSIIHRRPFAYQRSLEGQFEPNHDETVDSFDAMNLKSHLLLGVYEYGFENPSAVQQRAIMHIIKGSRTPIKQQQGGIQEMSEHWLRPCFLGNDVLVRALLDGDELATLSIPIVQNIDSDLPDCQALVLTPTRETAL